jgi:hypothetical protein
MPPNPHRWVGTEEHAQRSAISSRAARGDYEAKGAVQIAQDEFDCVLEEHPQGAPAHFFSFFGRRWVTLPRKISATSPTVSDKVGWG